MKEFTFYLPTRLVCGVNARQNLTGQLDRLSAARVLLVTDQGLIGVGIADKVTSLLEARGDIQFQVYDQVMENPLDSTVDAGYALAKEMDAQAIVGLGGGSVLDTATGIAMLAANGGKTLDYFQGKAVSKASLPTILIPTTAGTGSEINRCFVVTDPSNHFKDGIADDLMCPAVTILDPELTVTMPPRVTASTGIDAFTHAFEAYLSRNSHPLSDALNLHAMRLISHSLRKAYADPANLEARSAMLLGSAIAGIGFDQVGLILAHAMAHPLSGLFNVPHGVACGVVTPPVMEFNILAAPEKIAEVGELLGASMTGCSNVYERAKKAVEAFRLLLVDLQLPTTISELGVSAADIPKLTEDAFAAAGMRSRNPRSNTREDIARLYQALL